VMHLRKSNEQKIHGIQHQFDAHENNDRVPPRQYTCNSNTE
jgi:hypothetical protein